MEQKKRQVGASERDGFLRAAWRALVAGEIGAERLVFLPRLRGTEQRARSPRRDQAYRAVSEVFEPISSTNTNRSVPISPATSARQAALKNSSRSLAPTVLLLG